MQISQKTVENNTMKESMCLYRVHWPHQRAPEHKNKWSVSGHFTEYLIHRSLTYIKFSIYHLQIFSKLRKMKRKKIIPRPLHYHLSICLCLQFDSITVPTLRSWPLCTVHGFLLTNRQLTNSLSEYLQLFSMGFPFCFHQYSKLWGGFPTSLSPQTLAHCNANGNFA